MKHLLISTFVATAILAACTPKLTPNYKNSTIQTIEFDEYNRKKDITTYDVLPYGHATLPGKWVKGRYARISKQQLFIRPTDSLNIDLAFYSGTKLPFYTEGLSGNSLTQQYYEWETGYQKQELHKQIELLEVDTANKYIMWRVYDNQDLNTVQLIGARDCMCRDVAYQLYTVFGHRHATADLAAFAKQIYLAH